MSDFVTNHLLISIILMRDYKRQDNISERKVNREGEKNLPFQRVKEDLYDKPRSVYD
jgi:hypothetical protein